MEYYIGVAMLFMFWILGIIMVVKDCVRLNAKAKIYEELAEQKKRERERNCLTGRELRMVLEREYMKRKR